MANYMVKITIFIVNLWHTVVWFKITSKLLRYTIGRYILRIIHLLFGSLIILNILAPNPKEMPCLIHIFIRSNNCPYNRIKFKKRIKLLLKFWRS